MDRPRVKICIGAHQGPDFGVPASTIRSWAKRGRLHPRGLDAFNRPLYYLADVLELRAATRPTSKAA